MTTEIYYFSGTGNSFYVARELQKWIPDSTLVPIAALLNACSKVKVGEDERDKKIETTADTIGFVFPCHGLTIPIPVKKFLRKLDLTASEYLFAIATRGGNIFRGFMTINNILKKQEKDLHASFIINMYMNDPKLKSFIIPKSEELKEIERNVQQKLNLIQKTIINRELYQDDVSGATFSRFRPLNYVLERLIPFAVHHVATKVRKYFYADSKCTGCGNCEKVFLSKKITMVNDTPSWQRNIECYMCYACLNYCPTQAIQVYSKFYMKSFTKEKGRYPHPYARVQDMVKQKSHPSTP